MADTTCGCIARLVLVLALVGRFVASANRVSVEGLGAEAAVIDAFIRQEMEAGNIPGLAVGIVRGNRVLYLKGFGTAGPGRGEVTPQTPFVLGSVSKSITGLAVMQLVERGRLGLDDPVRSFLPWFAMGGADASSIRIAHLLSHTSGIPGWHGNDSGVERGGSLEDGSGSRTTSGSGARPGPVSSPAV